MNNKGFTLAELLAVIVIITIVLLIVYPAVRKISDNNSDELYKGYERMMVEYARVSSLNNNNIIKLNQLEELDKVKNECKGYVIINHSVTPNTYTAYIKCDNKYTTAGYDNSKA